MPATSPPVPDAHAHSHPPQGHGPGGRRPVAQVGGSALRASLGARLVVAMVLCAVMWIAVYAVVQS